MREQGRSGGWIIPGTVCTQSGTRVHVMDPDSLCRYCGTELILVAIDEVPTLGSAGQLTQLPADLLAAIEEALGDAYAYRLGEADPNKPDEIDEVDLDYMHKYKALADRLGVTIY